MLKNNPRASLIMQNIKAQHNSHTLLYVFYGVLQNLPKGVGVSSSVLMSSYLKNLGARLALHARYSKEACFGK